jgi:hypothetical protein
MRIVRIEAYRGRRAAPLLPSNRRAKLKTNTQTKKASNIDSYKHCPTVGCLARHLPSASRSR